MRFTNKTPLSFTAKIEFIDENGKIYWIPVSGTTDNCLFTNYPYFQRNQEKDYNFSEDDNKPLLVTETVNNDSSFNSLDKSGKIIGSHTFFAGSKAASHASAKSSLYINFVKILILIFIL